MFYYVRMPGLGRVSYLGGMDCSIIPGVINGVKLYTEQEMNSIKTMQQHLFEMGMKAKDDLLKKVAREVLKREPTLADAGRFQLVTHPNKEGEELCFEFIPLGWVHYKYGEFPNTNVVGWEFTPNKDFAK